MINLKYNFFRDSFLDLIRDTGSFRCIHITNLREVYLLEDFAKFGLSVHTGVKLREDLLPAKLLEDLAHTAQVQKHTIGRVTTQNQMYRGFILLCSTY